MSGPGPSPSIPRLPSRWIAYFSCCASVRHGIVNDPKDHATRLAGAQQLELRPFESGLLRRAPVLERNSGKPI